MRKDFNPAMNKIPMLSIEEEKALAFEYKRTNSKALADKLIMSNWRYVAKTAHQYSRRYGLSAYDLFQEGLAGMLKALSKFDPEKSYQFKNARFTSYAKMYIIYRMQHFILNNKSIIARNDIHARKAFFWKLSPEEHGENRLPGADVSVNVELSRPASDGHTTFQDVLVDKNADTALRYEDFSAKENLKNTIDKVLSQFDDREQIIIRGRFMQDEPATLQELGDTLKVSRERIRQIEVKLMERLTKIAKLNQLEEFCV